MITKKNILWALKELLIDCACALIVSIGTYNFANASALPLSGVTGIAQIFHFLFGVPIGWMIILINVPIFFLTYKTLGKKFIIRSVVAMIIVSLFIDYVAPLFPEYTGDRLLATVVTAVLTGFGYGVIFLRGSSTCGTDFILVLLRTKFPHLTLGSIGFIVDMTVISAGAAIISKDIDGFIYGMICALFATIVLDKVTFVPSKNKMAIIVTDQAKSIASAISDVSGRGSTIMEGSGSYTGDEKSVVLSACSNYQASDIIKEVRSIDKNAFTVIVDSSDVIGYGFEKKS